MLAYNVLFVLGFAIAISAESTCPTFSGELKGLEHDVAGTVAIAPDCTLTASAFSYDGQAPAVYWWAAPSCSPADVKNSGYRISQKQLEASYSNEEVEVPLLPSVDWSEVKCIVVYCEEFYADLGHVEISGTLAVEGPPPQSQPAPTPSKPAPAPKQPAPEPAAPATKPTEPGPEPPTPTPTPSPPTAPPVAPETVNDLANCFELMPGYFNAHWEVSADGKAVTLGLEGRPGTGNRWMAFGFSPSGSPGPVMVGSDVVVAGIVDGKCFAQNFRLSSKAQCDFATAEGACPDFAGTSPLKPTTSAELLACEREGDKLSVLVRRPLGASDGKSNAWSVDGSRFSVFAMGPVSEGSNATVPVILYHSLQLPGLQEAASVASSPADALKLALAPDSATDNCRKIVPMVAGSTPASGSGGGDVATIDGPTAFKVTIGSNKNYPNPPAWGYSLWVNNQESPMLVVRRGTTYSFTVAAGETHPVYITSSIIGGGSLVDYKGEKVFAGNDTTVGTPEAPAAFTWTPDGATPDTVYYQCTVHQKLGWQIKVADAGTAAPAEAPSPSAPPAAAPAAACSLTVAGETTSYGACQAVAGVGSNFMVYWTLEADPADPSTKFLSMGMTAAATAGQYVALGFSEEPGQMIGAAAMIMSACASCPGGAALEEYALGGKTSSAVAPANALQAEASAVAASFADGALSGRFQTKLRASSAARRRLMGPDLSSPPAAFPLIFAAGPATPAGAPQLHSSFGSGTFDLTASQVPVQEDSSGGSAAAPAATISVASTNTAARTAHMWLMALSFGVIMPLAIVAMRWWPAGGSSSLGFKLHRALQALGFAGATGGLAAGFVAGSGSYAVHSALGITVFSLAALQVLALVWRPSPDDQKLRRPWALGHRWLGRATAVLAISNIYYGIIHVAQLDAWAWATYTAVLAVIVAAAVGGEVAQRRRRPTAMPRAESSIKDDLESSQNIDSTTSA